MKNMLYAQSDLIALKARIRKTSLSAAGVFLITVAACVCICLLTNRQNRTVMQLAATALSVPAGWVLIHWIFDGILKDRHRRDDIAGALSAPTQEFAGSVTQLGERITFSRDVTVQVLHVSTDAASVQLYWDTELDMPDLLGKSCRFLTVRHRIIGYEVVG